jgi:hypothetical protein
MHNATVGGRSTAGRRVSAEWFVVVVTLLLATLTVSCSQSSSSSKPCAPGRSNSGISCASGGSSGNGSSGGQPGGGGGSGGPSGGGQSAGTAASSSPGMVTVEYSGSFQESASAGLSIEENLTWDEKVTVAVPSCAVTPPGTSGCVPSAANRTISPADFVGSPTVTVSGTASVHQPPGVAVYHPELNCSTTASPMPGEVPIRVSFALHQITVLVESGGGGLWLPSSCQAGHNVGTVVPVSWVYEPVAQIGSVLPYTKNYPIMSPAGGTSTLSITGNAQGCSVPSADEQPAASPAQAAARSSGPRAVLTALKTADAAGPAPTPTVPSEAAQPPSSAAAANAPRASAAALTAVTKGDDLPAGPTPPVTLESASNPCPSITWVNDPAKGSHDVNEGQETVSVGQPIELQATLNGQPVGSTDQVEWTLPGPVAQKYSESPSSAQFEPLPTGATGQSMVRFFWTSAGTGSDAVGAARSTTQTVQVTVDGRPAITHFTVTSPAWTFGPGAMCAAGLDLTQPHIAKVGTTQTSVPLPAFGLGDNDPPPTCIPGIKWSASVMAAPGKLGVTQLILDQMWQNGTACPLPGPLPGGGNVGYAADTSDFYAQGPSPGRLDSSDSPVFSLAGKSGTYKWLFIAQDYLMFQPAVPGSQWVPLARLDWRWTATVHSTGPSRWALDAATPPAPMQVTSIRWYREPEWSWTRSGDSNFGAPC